jgi:hypothetical protein
VKTYSYTALWRQIPDLAHHHSAAEVRIHLRMLLISWRSCGLRARPGGVGEGVVGMGGGNDAVSKERGGQVWQAKAVSLGWVVLRPRRFVWVRYGRESILEFQRAMRQR